MVVEGVGGYANARSVCTGMESPRHRSMGYVNGEEKQSAIFGGYSRCPHEHVSRQGHR